MTKELEIEITHEDEHYFVAALRGELTFADVERMKTILVRRLDVDVCRGMIIDCRNLDYVDSSGLGVVVLLHSRLNRKQGRLILARVQPGVVSILRIARLQKVIPQTRTVADATREMQDFLEIPPSHEEA